MENNNLRIWDRVRDVPAEAQKPFDNGSFKGTDINPVFRLKKLTEVFGPAGIGWYTEEVEHWNEEVNGEILVYCKIHLYVKDNGEWSKPILGIGGNKTVQKFTTKTKVTDEAYKMAYTDAISVACKALGIGADIYWQNDPTKYYQYYQEVIPTTPESAIAYLNDSTDVEDLQKRWLKIKPQFGKSRKVVVECNRLKAEFNGAQNKS